MLKVILISIIVLALLILFKFLISLWIIHKKPHLLITEVIETYFSADRINYNTENYLNIHDNKFIQILHLKEEEKSIISFDITEYETAFNNTFGTPRIEVCEYRYKYNILNKLLFPIHMNIFKTNFKKKRIIVYDRNVQKLKDKIYKR